MSEYLQLPSVRIWYTYGNLQEGFHSILEVDGEFFLTNDNADEPKRIVIQDLDGRNVWLTRAQIKYLHCLKCDCAEQKNRLFEAMCESGSFDNMRCKELSGAINSLMTALKDELKEVTENE